MFISLEISAKALSERPTAGRCIFKSQQSNPKAGESTYLCSLQIVVFRKRFVDILQLVGDNDTHLRNGVGTVFEPTLGLFVDKVLYRAGITPVFLIEQAAPKVKPVNIFLGSLFAEISQNK